MSLSHPKTARAWFLVPLAALGCFLLSTTIRIHRVEYISEVVGRPAGIRTDTQPWRPRLIFPGHHNESFEWLDQTHQMFDRAELRVRRVDYENAPLGHEVFAASPYRWWLGFLAWCHHLATGSPLDRSIERVALHADPLLLILFGAAGMALLARRLGPPAAAFFAVGLVALFPFASAYLPASPDSLGLARILAVGGELLILAGIKEGATRREGGESRTGRWFFAAGVAGGLAVWVSVPIGLPVAAGLVLGALAAAWRERRLIRGGATRPGETLPWRLWGFGGALTILAGFLLEFFPSYLGATEFRAVHPAYGLAWLGAAELLEFTTARIRGAGPRIGFRAVLAAVAGAAAVALLPVAMRLNHTLGFLEVDRAAMRLSMLPGAESASSFKSWLLEGGISTRVWETLLPLAAVLPAVGLLLRARCDRPRLQALAVTLGPVLVTLGFSCWQIGWWATLDGAVLVVLAATAWALEGGHRRGLATAGFAALTLAVLAPGMVALWPPFGLRFKGDLTKPEAVGLVERDFAYWLRRHVDSKDAIVLAPPNATVALYYYAGIRGLGTLELENRDGLTAAIRITSAATPEEAYELINRRSVSDIIIPRWDQYLDTYARLGEGQVEGTFLQRLHDWRLPPWLQAIPYLMPSIAGFEGQSVTVFEVVDEQDEATAIGHLAAYFVDMGEMDMAARAAQNLRRYPADAVALLARARVAIAAGDTDEFTRLVGVLQHRSAGGPESGLGWDDQVAYCIVLAQAHQLDLARTRLQRCLGDVDEEKLRLLSTNTLFRLELLSRALHLEIGDPKTQSAALELLPADLRYRLEK